MKYSMFLDNWLKEKKTFLKYSTYANYYNVIYNQIIPNIGEYDIESLNSDILQEFILYLLQNGRVDNSGGISQKYAKDIITILKLTLPDKDISIKLPYEEPQKIEIFQRDDQLKLINYIQANISSKNFGILLAINTGIRIGELCALKWSDINFDSKLLFINKTMIRTYTREDGSILNITSPKSKSSIRTIPLNSWIMYYANLLRSDNNHYILTNNQNHIEPDKYRLYYNKILRILNLPHLKFHALRHTFATRCIECGCDYKVLSEILGHSSPAITMNIYVHPQLELKRKCVELLVNYYQ